MVIDEKLYPRNTILNFKHNFVYEGFSISSVHWDPMRSFQAAHMNQVLQVTKSELHGHDS